MKKAITILYKLAITFVAALISFDLIDSNPINMIFIVTLISTICYFIFEDLLLSTRNILTSIGNGIIGAVIAYLIDLFSADFMASVTGLIIFAFLIAIGKYYFHIFLKGNTKEILYDYDKKTPE